MGRILGEIARRLADSVIFPIDCRLYTEFLAINRDVLKMNYGELMKNQSIDFSEFLCLRLLYTLYRIEQND